jgi:hypothetical protein
MNGCLRIRLGGYITPNKFRNKPNALPGNWPIGDKYRAASKSSLKQ